MTLGTPAVGCGYERESGLYFEVLGARRSSRAPWLFIPGGGATGACFRVKPDGRSGWADQLARRGHQCWLTDWPGTGRSGGCDPLKVDYTTLVDGYANLLRNVIGRPVVIVCHSMGGGVAWKLAEVERQRVAGVVALASSYPGNIAPIAQVLRDDGTTVILEHPDSGVEFTVRRDRLYLYSDAYITQQGIATSTRFPRELIDVFRRTLIGIPPKLALQRLGADGGVPPVVDHHKFSGLWVRDITGSEDPAHTRAIEEKTVNLLADWSADAELIYLPDRGIEGNGHFFFLEENSDTILELRINEADQAIA